MSPARRLLRLSSLSQPLSTPGNLTHGGHRAMSGDIFTGYRSLGVGGDGEEVTGLVGGGQGSQTPSAAQDSLPP